MKDLNALIVVPACNEAASLETFLPRLRTAAEACGADAFNILVVDDGSTDSTVAVAKKHGCWVETNGRNMGLGCTLRRGFLFGANSGFNHVVTLDSDGQHDPRFLKEVVRILREDSADIVIASRYHPKSERVQVPLDRDLLNIAVAAQMRVVTGWNLTDPLSGFWGMKISVAEFALKHERLPRYGTCLERLIKLWHISNPRPRLVEIPHPAIYGNHGELPLLTREYSPGNREPRIDRFGTHALHILEALDDVRAVRGAALDEGIKSRRWE